MQIAAFSAINRPAASKVNNGSVPSAPVPAPGVAQDGRLDDATFKNAAEKLRGANAQVQIARDSSSQAATFISGSFSVEPKPNVGGSGADRLARTFLLDNGSVFGITNQAQQLNLVSSERDDLGFTHLKYQQTQNGLPVFGQQLVVHMRGSDVQSIGGRTTPNITASATPKVTVEEAIKQAVASAKDSIHADGKLAGNIKVGDERTLGYFTTEDGTPKLAYEITVGNGDNKRMGVFVDAQTGTVLQKYDQIHSALNRETMDMSSKWGGKIRRAEGSEASGDKAVDAAHDFAKDVYDFYNDKYGRDSIDGKGMKIRSRVHYGNNYNNAFWDGSQMTYGDGDGKMFIPLSLGADVVGHEMAHGVTERTAGLRYFAQSGALNESWSDVFGNLIEKFGEERSGKPESDPKWMIGEAVFTPDVAGDALRSMSAPGTAYKGDKQPANMKDYIKTSQDNGGVHWNSGITNKAAYDTVQAIGKDKVSDIWFRALTKYMTSGSQFSDAANAVTQSAIDLYGAGSAEASAVSQAWEGVGLKPGIKVGITEG